MYDLDTPAISEAGIDLDAVTQQLEDGRIQKFVKTFDGLMKTLKSPKIGQRSLK
jgi:hypothetical protein